MTQSPNHTMLLYLIRHGRSTWNAEDRMQGQADPPLDELGREQARALGQRLQADTFDVIYASPLVRARLTAEIAFPGAPLRFDDRLMERHLGEWTGLTWDEIVARHLDRGGVGGEADWRVVGPPGGEGQAALVARAATVLDEIRAAHPAGQVAVVSHGGLLSAGLTHLLGIPPEQPVGFSFPNTAIARVSLKEGLVRVLGLDASHLENSKPH